MRVKLVWTLLPLLAACGAFLADNQDTQDPPVPAQDASLDQQVRPGPRDDAGLDAPAPPVCGPDGGSTIQMLAPMAEGLVSSIAVDATDVYFVSVKGLSRVPRKGGVDALTLLPMSLEGYIDPAPGMGIDDDAVYLAHFAG